MVSVSKLELKTKGAFWASVDGCPKKPLSDFGEERAALVVER
jgi:hypothetical protein